MSATTNLNEFCRLCLTKCDRFVGIFDNTENRSLSPRILSCLALEVQETDALPKSICPDCRQQLEKAHYFRLKSRNSDMKLRRHLRLIGTGKTSNVFETAGNEDDQHEDDYIESREMFALWDREARERTDHSDEEVRRRAATELTISERVATERRRICAAETQRIFEKALKHFATEKERTDAFERQCAEELEARMASASPPPIKEDDTTTTTDHVMMDDAQQQNVHERTQKFFDLVGATGDGAEPLVEFKMERVSPVAAAIDTDDDEATESLLMQADEAYYRSYAESVPNESCNTEPSHQQQQQLPSPHQQNVYTDLVSDQKNILNIVRHMESKIKYGVDNINVKLDCLLQMRSSGSVGIDAGFSSFIGGGSGSDNVDIFMDDDGLLPLKTVEDIYNFERKLEEPEYKMKLLTCLKRSFGADGTGNGKKIAYALTDRLFKRSLLTKFSWTGNSKGVPKQQFSALLRTNRFFIAVVNAADARYTEVAHMIFFKNCILKYSEQRNKIGSKRSSTPRACTTRKRRKTIEHIDLQ